MERQFVKAMTQIQAEPALKERTRQAVRKQIGLRKCMRPVLAACCLLCLTLYGSWLYFTPTSILSIDINPSIELSINRFDRVIDLKAFNEDGEALLQTLDVLHQSYTSAFETIMDSDMVTTCLSEDQLLSVAVVELDDQQGEVILDYVSECICQHENAYCYGITSDEVAQAHNLGLSYGKYRLYLELQTQNISISLDDVKQMTMKELQQLLNQQENEAPNGSGYQQGYGHQHRYGHHAE